MIVKPNSPVTSLFLFPCLIALAAVTMSGCSSLMMFGSSSVPPVVDSAGNYRVEMKGGFGKQSVYTGELDQPTTVQNALENAGAIDKFRHMEIMVLRVVEENGIPLKMPIRFDVGKKAVTPEQDYAIHAGDRIIVQEKSNSFVGDVLDSLGGG